MAYKKPPGNPIIEELNKTHRERSINLADLQAIKVTVEGKVKRKCAWCAVGDLKHGNQKYCGSECSHSAMAWAYPQKEDGLGALLIAQEWKCRICSYDWSPLAHQVHADMNRRYMNSSVFNPSKFDWTLVKRLKYRAPKDHRPEVDHIIPIYKGGQSIGLDNHQAICYTCHKAKTSLDNKGPRNGRKN